MELISNYLKTVFQDLKQESKQNPAFICIILTLWSIPLSHAYSSISVIVFTLVALFTFKKSKLQYSKALFLPIILFVLMAASLLWTTDLESSVKALQKSVPFFVVPICFLLIPRFSKEQRYKILHYFSLGMVVFAMFYLLKAMVRFALTKDTAVFFYHELVTEEVNAIHVSLYMAISAIYFLTKSSKSLFDKFAILLLSTIMVLLSSKNIIVIFVLLLAIYLFKTYRSAQKSKILKGGLILVFLISLAFIGFIKDRFLIEVESNITENSINTEIGTPTEKVYNVSISRAWHQEKFKQNDYFPGAAFRVYQIRVFKEMLVEDPIFFSGYGLNAADFRISEKSIENGVFTGNSTSEGYQNQNFHNQYIQLFAELGIFGFLILIAMLGVNIKNAVKTKDFMHISFAILMISLFLTESFLSRQRGIVFFTIMYCLFNSGASIIGTKKE